MLMNEEELSYYRIIRVTAFFYSQPDYRDKSIWGSELLCLYTITCIIINNDMSCWAGQPVWARTRAVGGSANTGERGGSAKHGATR